MLIIDASNAKKPFDEILKDHDLILSREIINSVCEAIDLELPKILVAIIKIPGGYIADIISWECQFKKALRTNMMTLIVAQEFELCAKAKKYMDRLEEVSEGVLN